MNIQDILTFVGELSTVIGLGLIVVNEVSRVLGKNTHSIEESAKPVEPVADVSTVALEATQEASTEVVEPETIEDTLETVEEVTEPDSPESEDNDHTVKPEQMDDAELLAYAKSLGIKATKRWKRETILEKVEATTLARWAASISL